MLSLYLNFGLIGVFTKLSSFLTRDKYFFKPRFTKASPYELQFEIPVSGLANTDDIKMRVDANNKFILYARNDEQSIYYVQHLNLPQGGNFEKAIFKAKLDAGLVDIIVTNFQKEEVEVEFK